MPYLTLEEAAQYANRKTGQQIIPENLLRAGVAGILPICAPFGSCVMYNATTKENENFCADLLIIPPTHLLEIETEGEANIQVAFSLDGKTIYFPHRKRTLDQLRVLVNSLDEFIPSLVPVQQAPMQKTPDDNEPISQQETPPGKLPNPAIGKLAVKVAWALECKFDRRATADEVIKELQRLVSEEDILVEKIPRGVRWMTTKLREKDYDITTCCQTLDVWHKSRA